MQCDGCMNLLKSCFLLVFGGVGVVLTPKTLSTLICFRLKTEILLIRKLDNPIKLQK